eukprot:1142986-Pelagomonas_calceolata.AAC.1
MIMTRDDDSSTQFRVAALIHAAALELMPAGSAFGLCWRHFFFATLPTSTGLQGAPAEKLCSLRVFFSCRAFSAQQAPCHDSTLCLFMHLGAIVTLFVAPVRSRHRATAAPSVSSSTVQ